MKHKTLIIVILLAIASASAYLVAKRLPESGEKLSCSKCNVILISMDALGARHLGLYGYERATSPFLDELAKTKGIVFETAIVQAPWTLPSHTAMLTGRYPAEFGVWMPQDKLSPEVKTLAEALKDRGYDTWAISNGHFVQPEWGFDQGFDLFSGKLPPALPPDGDDMPQILSDAYSLVRERANTKQPFFLFLRPWHLQAPHTPSEEALIAVAGRTQQPVEQPMIVQANMRPGGATQEEIEHFRDVYDAEIREFDTAFRDFYQKLGDMKLLEKTIIIITGDHGREFGEHGIAGFHGQLYDETIRVPLLIFHPRAKPARIGDVVEIRSIPSTVLDLLNLPLETSFSAPSLLRDIGNIKGESIALSVSALDRENFFPLVIQFNKALLEKKVTPVPRDEEWQEAYASSGRGKQVHLIKTRQGLFELYDLINDPSEKENLYPLWEKLVSDFRREALKVIEVFGSDVPVPCGVYCADKNE